VYHDLGLEHRLSLGRGVVALFTGPPGTGKTLAATTLAGLLRKDLYKVDTAAVASRFVGETEKNLGRVFADVQGANAVLFFDEADALFGKRGEVVQAADRWANLQISFLLQRIEEYTGTVILATNYRENIDPAFFRRVHMLIEFPKPDAADRLGILEGTLARTGLGLVERELRLGRGS
jgi:SpoVK/Ycf46/Vps4 family AAA+-type ATPase